MGQLNCLRIGLSLLNDRFEKAISTFGKSFTRRSIMKRLFLFRLYKFSRPAFFFVLLFIIFYAVVFYKKMDMVIFPYNNMFALKTSPEISPSTYAMRINGKLVPITDFPYWKKDFLETSLFNFAKFLQQGEKVFLEDYLKAKGYSKWAGGILNDRLLPDKNGAKHWPVWYTDFANQDIKAGDTYEIVRYNFEFTDDNYKLNDSVIIFSDKF